MNNEFKKVLYRNALIILYVFIITFLLFVFLVIKYNNEFNFINYKYNNIKNIEKITYINTNAFNIKEVVLLKKTKEKLPISNQTVQIKKTNNNYILIIKNYYDRCSNIDGSYFLEGKDSISWIENIEMKEKIYTINIVSKDNWYIKKNYCSYNLLLEINYTFSNEDIIYIMLNGNIYKYNIKDIV